MTIVGTANPLFTRSQIAFLKSYSTQCAQDTARDAVQIFGGRGVTKTGMGRFIEHVCFLSFFLCRTTSC
jgi:alkylation response protein AidB-like acyl-CoA dehydrogenase